MKRHLHAPPAHGDSTGNVGRDLCARLPEAFRIAGLDVDGDVFCLATVFRPEFKLRIFVVICTDLSLRWLRCDRSLSADSWVLTDVPMAEVSEAYDLEILSGATVKRSLTVATSAFTYTSAMQTTDFGGPVNSLSIRLYQIGALGRGVPHVETITIKESL